ncbi:hypothetical protein C2E23DRAFT_824673 [Lenzites betulinus]|nr:hypothetical protein C2E23DRAFT_824673 [Lenzites betulinus]
MSRRHAGAHTLPENPEWIEFPRSDGNYALLPKNTEQVVDGDGHVNYMRPVGLEESQAILWRVAVGSQLAVRMGLPAGRNYVLKTWPEGYQLYDHNKGPLKAPRHDPYLCGSVSVNRFRSTNEFIPHALWLMQDATMNRGNCSCKYCTKQPQRIISDTMGLSTHPARRSSSVAGAVPSSRRPSRPRRELREPRAVGRVPPKPYAAVRRAPKPPKVILGPEQYILPERDLDTRAALISGEGQRPRWFRKGELLWCHLEPPIRGLTPDEDIQFWPALVEDFHVKTQPVFESPDGMQAYGEIDVGHLYKEAADDNPALGDVSNGTPAGSSRATDPPLEAEGSVPWKVQQWYVYKMKLLGTAQYCLVTDQQVLPYLAYAPSDLLLDRVRDELAQFMNTVPIDAMDRDIELISMFDPMEPEPQGEDIHAYYAKYQRAAAPYTLAIQIAANVAQYWLPTDEWECKFIIPPDSPSISSAHPPSASQAPPPPSSASRPSTPSQPATLHSLITQSLSQNAISPALNGTTSSHPESISTQARLPRASAPAPQTVIQMRFQGLWWGTERIWTDELVRLKIARCQFAPKGTDVIFPPAGPSMSTLENMKDNPEALNADPQRLGASEKGLFLRLEGLFVVDVMNAEGTGMTRECRASGMVYELADDDWEDATNASPPAETNGSGKGKEKATEVPDSSDMATQSDRGAPTFMSQPSPLKPPPLPNPDPTVPLADTANAMLTQTSPEAAARGNEKTPSLEDQLSRPVLTSPYPLPPATKGFRFRPILPPGHEAIVSLSLISGRYYPGLFHHPLMAPTVAHALSLTSEEVGLYDHRHLWAMEGLLPGIYQSMDPRQWRKSRTVMLQEAASEARDRFSERWEETKMARLHPPESQPEGGDVSMDGPEASMEVD